MTTSMAPLALPREWPSGLKIVGLLYDIISPSLQLVYYWLRGKHVEAEGGAGSRRWIVKFLSFFNAESGDTMKYFALLVICISLVCLVGCVPRDGQLPAQEAPGDGSASLADPSATYCQKMGFKYQFAATEAGQVGMCHFPDGSSCTAWNFLTGKCGEAYSYCAQHGYKQEVRADGQNPISYEYAVCIDAAGQVVGAVSSLAGLESKPGNP
ncbi:MAG: DUF333 domain-containing protein [Anaerolineales bacterium]|nr:DUF333 domain-containing protein [Anaerolineales bacterium]